MEKDWPTRRATHCRVFEERRRTGRAGSRPSRLVHCDARTSKVSSPYSPRPELSVSTPPKSVLLGCRHAALLWCDFMLAFLAVLTQALDFTFVEPTALSFVEFPTLPTLPL